MNSNTIGEVNWRERHRRFTNRESQLELFESMLQLTNPPFRILGVHGSAGVGKSELIDEFKFYCRDKGIPYVSIDGYGQKNALGIVNRLRKQAGKYVPHHKFAEFDRYILLYLEMQRVILNDQRLIANLRQEIDADRISERQIDLGELRRETSLGKLKESYQDEEISFFLNAENFLAEKLAEALAKNHRKSNWLLMVDVFEKMEGIETWLRSHLIEKLPDYFRVVLAGRNPYTHSWRNMPVFRSVELANFGLKDTERYLKARGIKLDEFVNEVFALTEGQPLFLAISADAKEKNPDLSVSESDSDKVFVLDSIVEYVRETIANSKLQRAHDVCSIVRFFNRSALNYLLPDPVSEEEFGELLRYSWVKRRSYGHALHDAVREHIQAEYRDNELSRFLALNLQAVNYYNEMIELKSEEDWQPYAMELVYHKMIISRKEGLDFLVRIYNIAEAQYRLDFCDALLEEVRSYEYVDLGEWVEMLEARLAVHRDNWKSAKRSYESILRNKALDVELAAYVLTGFGIACYRLGELDEAEDHFEHALKAHKAAGRESETISLLHYLAKVNMAQRDWQQTSEHLEEALSQIDGVLDKLDVQPGKSLYPRTFLDDSKMLKRERAAVLTSYGIVRFERGLFDDALDKYSESLELFKLLGDQQGVAISLYRIGWVLQNKGKWNRAMEFYEQAHDIFAELGADYWVARAIVKIADLHCLMGEYEASKRVYDECMNICVILGAPLGISVVTDCQGRLAQVQGRLREAEELHLGSLELKKEQGFPFEIEITYMNLGDLKVKQGEVEQALNYYDKSLQLMKDMEYMYGEAMVSSRILELLVTNDTPDRDTGELFDRVMRLVTEYEYFDVKSDLELVRAQKHIRMAEVEGAMDAFRQALSDAEDFNQYKRMEISQKIKSICSTEIVPNGLRSLAEQILQDS